MVVTSQENCKKKKKYIQTNQFCAIAIEGKNPTGGDSGSALTLEGSNLKNPTIVGLVSHGSRTKLKLNDHVVYTRVASYIEWIEQQTNLVFY